MRKEIEGLNLEHQSYNYKKNKYNYDDNYSYDIDEDFNMARILNYILDEENTDIVLKAYKAFSA